jgi:hypothetical protein
MQRRWHGIEIIPPAGQTSPDTLAPDDIDTASMSVEPNVNRQQFQSAAACVIKAVAFFTRT